MEYRNRAEPCSHCGDVVLIAVRQPLGLPGLKGRFMINPSAEVGQTQGPGFGRRRRPASENRLKLEHADPSPDGEAFDGVDADCRRAPVRPGFPR